MVAVLRRTTRLLTKEDVSLIARTCGNTNVKIDSPIGWDAIARANFDDVARDELARGEVADPLTGAEASRGVALHLLERLERALRVALLPHAHDGVQHEDQ